LFLRAGKETILSAICSAIPFFTVVFYITSREPEGVVVIYTDGSSIAHPADIPMDAAILSGAGSR
jgi:hypothetical protein